MKQKKRPRYPMSFAEFESELTATKLKLASAEARVKELEGLRVLSRDIGTITLLLDQDLSTVPPLTLGEAMPRKEGE